MIEQKNKAIEYLEEFQEEMLIKRYGKDYFKILDGIYNPKMKSDFWKNF